MIVTDDNSSIHQDIHQFLARQAEGENCRLITHNGVLQNELLPKLSVDLVADQSLMIAKIKDELKKDSPYSLVFIDFKTPLGTDSIQFLQQIWAIDRTVQIIIYTNHAESMCADVLQDFCNDNLFILKSFCDSFSIQQLLNFFARKKSLIRASEESARAFNLLNATLQSMGQGILVMDLRGNVLNYNSKFLSIWGLSSAKFKTSNEQEILAHMLGKLRTPDNYLYKINQLKKDIHAHSQQAIQFEDSNMIIECDSQPYKVGNEVAGRVWVFRDITTRVNLEQRMHFQATHDPLTGLPNRTLLTDRINQSIIDADRNNSHLAILFFDIDGFKTINDNYSHEVGDQLLRALARRLRALMRAGDTISRIGGDEFVLLLSTLNNSKDNKFNDVVNIAHKVVASFKRAFRLEDKEIKLTTSIGISLYPDDGKNTNQLLKSADLAMY